MARRRPIGRPHQRIANASAKPKAVGPLSAPFLPLPLVDDATSPLSVVRYPFRNRSGCLECSAHARWPNRRQRPCCLLAAKDPANRHVAYDRWLTFLALNRLLDPNQSPGERLTPKQLCACIDELAATVAPYTLRSRIRDLGQALRVMAPEHDFPYLRRAIARLKARCTGSALDGVAVPRPARHHVQKDGARLRAAAPRCPAPPQGLVRRSAGSRSREADLHR